MSTVNQILAGAGQIDITPAHGSRINGDFMTHFATQFHDPLYAKCLILRNGHEIVAWVVVDICTMSQDFIDPVKSKIYQSTGIPERNILIASTHTHAAGAIEEVHLSALDFAYREKLSERIPLCVQEAFDKLRPAELVWSSFSAPDHVLCRRYHMTDDYKPVNPVHGGSDRIKTNPFGLKNWIDGPVADPDMEVSWLAVRGIDGQWISVMANYSLHYVGDWDNGTISADYYGVFAQAVQQYLGAGEDFIGIMTNGTSGDINIWDFKGTKQYPKANFEKSRLIGEDIARKLVDELQDQNQWKKEAAIEVTHRSLSVGVRKANEEELKTARTIVEGSDYENFEYSDDGLRKVYAREQLLLDETPDERSVPLQVFRIDSLIIGALPGEFFAETGLALKKEPVNSLYFTIGLANGNVGYVPPAHEIELGGYETWRCRYSCLEVNAEDLIRKELIDMVHSVSEG